MKWQDTLSLTASNKKLFVREGWWLLPRFGENQCFGAVLVYRYLVIDYGTSSRGRDVDMEITLSGPEPEFALRINARIQFVASKGFTH